MTRTETVFSSDHQTGIAHVRCEPLPPPPCAETAGPQNLYSARPCAHRFNSQLPIAMTDPEQQQDGGAAPAAAAVEEAAAAVQQFSFHDLQELLKKPEAE